MRKLCGESMTSSLDGKIPDWGMRRLMAVASVASCLLAVMIIANHTDQHATQTQQIAATDAAERAIFTNFETDNQRRQPYRAAFTSPDAQTGSPTGLEHVATFGVADIIAAELIAQERRCLTEAMYYEAAFEPAIGQMAVADVVLNRMESTLYPNSICEVVYQGSHRRTGCQFSFTCDGALSRPRNNTIYAALEVKAGTIMAGLRMPISLHATHYHADYVTPYWAHSLVQTTTIGTHKFYRPATRGGTLTASIAGHEW